MNENPRKWLQFRLGDMMWIVLVAAILASWWADRRRFEDQGRVQQQWLTR